VPEPRAALLAKVQAMELPEITPQPVSAIGVPVLLITGDSDIVTPEHAAATFRLLGRGAPGDRAPLPRLRGSHAGDLSAWPQVPRWALLKRFAVAVWCYGLGVAGRLWAGIAVSLSAVGGLLASASVTAVMTRR
jgi:hypothetical protein